MEGNQPAVVRDMSTWSESLYGVEEEEEEEESADVEDVAPIEEAGDDGGSDDEESRWYILKVQVNREDSICDALQKRVKLNGLEAYFKDIIVPTEDVAEFTKTGKRRVVKRKLYPGYIMVNMVIRDDTWFLVRETPGIGDFTGSAGKPTPMDPAEVERILKLGKDEEEGEGQIKVGIPFKIGERVRVKEGYFQNFEGEVEGIDEANGRVTVMINIFGRSTPVELEHWQIESV
jgi:transcriptional antiterminator NusG